MSAYAQAPPEGYPYDEPAKPVRGPPRDAAEVYEKFLVCRSKFAQLSHTHLLLTYWPEFCSCCVLQNA